MTNLYKEAKTINGINRYLKKIGLDGFGMDSDTLKVYAGNRVDYFDFDGWINSEETKGVSVTFYKNKDSYEVFVTKYTKEDIAQAEAELLM